MKNLFWLITAIVLYSCKKEKNITPVDYPFIDQTTLRVPNSVKKGVGLVESRFGAVQLDSLGVTWYYSWGPSTTISTPKLFVPMCFSLNTITKLTSYSTLLGFNEPDNATQSNMSVATALSNWPTLVAKSTRLGSPATAGNPLNSGSWLSSFMVANPKVDFVCVHWYRGASATTFINDMKAIIAKWNKPVWVTEFAPQTVSSSTASPNKYTQSQVNTFVNTVVHWMETEPMIEKYAWHDSKSGTSAIFTTDGKLTPTGIAYRDAK